MKTSRIVLFFAAFAAAVSLSMSCEKPEGGNTEGGETGKVEDIKVVDGKVKFYVDIDKDSPRSKAGITSRLTKVSVNGKEYTPAKDEKGQLFVEVPEAASGTYSAVYYNTVSKKFYGTSANIDVKIPHSQFHLVTMQSLQDYPMYSSYTKETGNKLVFKDGFALVDLALTGSAAINSVNVKNVALSMMTGLASYKPSTGSFAMTKGVGYAQLNCTRDGSNVPLAEGSAKHFYVMVAPGNYSKGLQITVSDASHRMMQFTTEAVTLTGNQVLSISKVYEPASELLFYEGFDNYVWGGDYVNGEGAIGFSPTADAVTMTSSDALTGLEEAYAQVAYDMPGTGYIQSDTWADCQNTYSAPKTVATSHRLTESYVKSRAAGDHINLFRCQERPGYIECGAAAGTRGIFISCPCRSIDGVINAKVEFDICLKHNFNDNIIISLNNGGYIRSCKVNGVAIDLKSAGLSYTSVSHELTVPASKFTIETSATARKKWNHVEVEVDRAMNGLMLYLAAASSSSGNHGFYLDNYKVTKISDLKRGKLRVLYWNIQNGMWSDQANNYDNFVKFVKAYDPDVCVWCESVTIYKDNTGSGIGNSGSTYKGFLPNGWPALAARYGHNYTAIGGCRDNYPQTVTAKFPITTIAKITNTDNSSKPIAHGAGLHSITVNGRTIYLATLHTWPQAYAYGVSGTAAQDASKAANGGDYYREYEMDYVVAQTKNNSKYAAQKDWLFMGDFNSRSRLDNWYYKYADSDTKLLCQDVILNKTDYKDIIGTKYEGDFMASTYGNARIDYMYASPSMYATVKNAMAVVDDWTTASKDLKYGTSFINPSDHRPILVDFEF
ncbi:MAG: metal-dependent hydrolase [Bacteroidales bacterium]|nr:metal-dependent hydrolase [Bacteroidales bacterium]